MTYQRDAGMILPEKDHHDKVSQREQEWRYEPFPSTGLHVRGTAPVESEYVIVKDDIDAPDWYCAQVLKVLPDRVKVAWLTTKVAPLTDYKNKSRDKRLARLKDSVFVKTRQMRRWVVQRMLIFGLGSCPLMNGTS